MPIIEQFKDKEEAMQFLEKLGEKVKTNTEAYAQTKVLQGKIQLDSFNNIEKTKVSCNVNYWTKLYPLCIVEPLSKEVPISIYLSCKTIVQT